MPTSENHRRLESRLELKTLEPKTETSREPATTSSPADPLGEHLRTAAALYLWELEAIQVRPAEPFRLASGNFSPIYVNCRRVISEPGFLQLFVAAAQRLAKRRDLRFGVVAGGETAGIPFAAFLASALALPLVYVRKKAKTHGLADRIEGKLPAGARVLLVEDLITDGGSKLGFLEAIAEAGGQVTDALVLFDREQGGGELLRHHGVRLHAVTDRSSTLAAGVAAGWLPAEDRRAVEDYFADPAAWHEQRGLAFLPLL